MTRSDVGGAPGYRLSFLPAALDKWRALDGSVNEVVRKLLKKRLERQRVLVAIHGPLRDCYKIKLIKQGYRLDYQIKDNVLMVCGSVLRAIEQGG